MPALSFLDALRQSRLLEAPQLHELSSSLQAKFPDPRLLAKELIQRGWLTSFQVNKLFQGSPRELLLGPYVILERLGEGTLGRLYKARHQKQGRLVALRVIRKELIPTRDVLRQIKEDVRQLSSMVHVNLVAIYEADESDGQVFVATEFVEGSNLAALVKEKGKMGTKLACRYVRQAALALQQLHERGMVHRNITPSSLLVTGNGALVKVADTGLSRLVHVTDEAKYSTMTQEGSGTGYLDYLSPEVADNADTADVRSDLYSLGCTFYYLVAGQVPFPGGNAIEKLLRHRSEAAVPVEELRPEVMPGVRLVVRKLMSKRPEQRYQSAGDVAGILPSGVNRALDGERRTRPRVTRRAPAKPRVTKPARRSWKSRIGSVAKRVFRIPTVRPSRRILLLAAFVVAVVTCAVIVARPRKEQAGPNDAPLDRWTHSMISTADLWATAPPELVAIFSNSQDGGKKKTLSMAFSRDGTYLTTGYDDGEVRFWNLTTGKPSFSRNAGGPVKTIVFSVDGRLTWAAGKAVQFNLETNAETGLYTFGACSAAYASEKAVVAIGFTDGTIKLRDSIRLDEKRLKPIVRESVDILSISPDGSKLAIGNSKNPIIRVCSDDGRQIASVSGKSVGGTISAGFMPDGKTVVIAGIDRAVRFYDPFEKKEGVSLDDLPEKVESGPVVALDGSMVAAAGASNVQVWDTRTGAVLCTLYVPRTPLALAFAADNRHLAAAGPGGQIWIFRVLPKPKE